MRTTHVAGKTTRLAGWLAGTLLACSAGAGAAQAATLAVSVTSPQEGPLRYARVGGKASVKNLASDNGVELLRPEEGGLVAVYRELPDWLEVEVPGGYAVWVYGKYLAETNEADILEVTRNAVNMRPLPKSDVNSFPLPQRLHAGDRVRLIQKMEADKALQETWVRIWSPPGVCAYLRAAQTTPLAAEADGAALWKEACRDLGGRRPPTQNMPKSGSVGGSAVEASAVREAEAKEAGSPTAVRAQLEEARVLLDREIARPKPEFGGVRKALEALLQKESTGPVAIEARHQLELVAFHEEAARLRSELERAKNSSGGVIAEKRAEILERSRAKDPFGHVFASRGVLVRKVTTDGTPHYFLRFAGATQCEVVCPGGRYDFDVFAGYEVGVQGKELGQHDGEAPLFEVARLEVLARR